MVTVFFPLNFDIFLLICDCGNVAVNYYFKENVLPLF